MKISSLSPCYNAGGREPFVLLTESPFAIEPAIGAGGGARPAPHLSADTGLITGHMRTFSDYLFAIVFPVWYYQYRAGKEGLTMDDKIVCPVCGQYDAEFTDTFILANSNYSKSSQYIGAGEVRETRTYSESVSEFKRMGICSHCLDAYKKRELSARIKTYVGLFITAIVLYFIMRQAFLIVFSVIFVLAGIYDFCRINHLVTKDWPFVLEEEMRLKEKNSMQYVPTNPVFYRRKGELKPNEKLFLRKNKFAVSGFGEKLFRALYQQEQ